LVEYHTRHHQLYNCNYSISPWCDKLCGTYRIDLPEAYKSVNTDGVPENQPAVRAEEEKEAAA
jgi:sterol desaturase/sphingolipid hydroxylase (fatty acid hydroxylase superfamily)